jgi:thiamine-phosphate pyrophosphorylase
MFGQSIIKGIYAITTGTNETELFVELNKFHKHGIKILQYRDKVNSDPLKLSYSKKLRLWTRERNMLLIINDSVSIALESESDGVHLGQNDLDISKARGLAPELIIGVSTHNKEQILCACQQDVDYIAIGPLYGTKSKNNPEYCEGPELVHFARLHTDLPLVGIGGIKAEHLESLFESGLDSVAMIESLKDESSVVKLVETLKSIEYNRRA